jgi:hypothetical protein
MGVLSLLIGRKHPMHRAKLVQYFLDKAEAIFVRAKYWHKDADKTEMRGQELEAKASKLQELAQARRADADKSEELGQQFDAKAEAQHEVARTQREMAAETEVLGHQI